MTTPADPCSSSTLEDATQRTCLKQEILKEIFNSLCCQSSWLSDDKLEHRPLDTETIVHLVEDQFSERMEAREAELTKKLKSVQEREIRAIKQRCLKDKQAVRLEVEADKKTMNLEVGRVKKRLIEAEREKHQSACLASQAQRDAKSLRSRLHDAESELRSLAKAVNCKTEEKDVLEKQLNRLKSEKDYQMQSLKECVSNLEAKLNNQDAVWNERCSNIMKVNLDMLGYTVLDLVKDAELDKAALEVELKDSIRSKCFGEAERNLALVFEKLRRFKSGYESVNEEIEEIREIMARGVGEIAVVGKVENELAIVKDVFEEMETLFRQTREENLGLTAELAGIKNKIRRSGFPSVDIMSDKLGALRDEIGEVKEEESILKAEIEECRLRESELKENLGKRQREASDLQNQVDNLTAQLAFRDVQLDEASRRAGALEIQAEQQSRENKNLENKISELMDLLTQTSNLKSDLETEIDRLRQESEDQLLRLKSEIESVSKQRISQAADCLRSFKTLFFADRLKSLDVLWKSIDDATTHSCIRSLNLSLQLRSTGVHRKREGSAVHSIVTMIKAELDSLVMSSDLQSILDHLKTISSPMPDQEDSKTGDEVERELNEIKCCLFWLLLDGRIRREREADTLKAEAETSPPKRSSFLKRRLRSIRTRRKSNCASLEMSRLCHGDTLSSSEASEIVEIISVLKEYLKTGKQDQQQ